MREEIWAGLKNAMERGATLEQAVQSFINSGYSPGEVQEAAKALSEGATTISQGEVSQPIQQKPIAQPVKERKEEPLRNDLPSVKLSTAESQEEVKSIQQLQASTDTKKVLYVPGSQDREAKEKAAASLQKSTLVGYVPYNGALSTRKKRIIALIIFVFILLILLAIGIIFWNDIFGFLKKFYATN